jgi:hypothetical protein
MDAGNLQAIIDEALKSASDEANRRLAAQDKKLPPINTTVEASSQTNYRQPAYLEQRVTEMRFDPPPPVAPKPEGIIDDTLLLSAGSGLTDGQAHQWKVTAATKKAVNVTGGVFRSQGDFDQADVPDVVELEAGASGYVILTVVRDIDSREVVEIPEISYVEDDLPESDYNNQIIPLAKVTVEGEGEEAAITNILQLKFEELHVFEDLVVVNGEFRFAELLMAGRKIYELPPP